MFNLVLQFTNDDYYKFMLEGRKVVQGIGILDAEHIIPFKMFAWLDLKRRKESGEHVNERDLKKHKNDVFRLVASVDVGTRLTISGQIEKDARRFLDSVRHEPVDVNNLGIRNATYEELVEVIMNCYGLKI